MGRQAKTTSAQKAGVTAAGIRTRTKKAAPLDQLRTGGDYRAQAAAVESPRQAKTTSAQKAGVTAAGIGTRTKKPGLASGQGSASSPKPPLSCTIRSSLSCTIRSTLYGNTT